MGCDVRRVVVHVGSGWAVVTAVVVVALVGETVVVVELSLLKNNYC